MLEILLVWLMSARKDTYHQSDQSMLQNLCCMRQLPRFWHQHSQNLNEEHTSSSEIAPTSSPRQTDHGRDLHPPSMLRQRWISFSCPDVNISLR